MVPAASPLNIIDFALLNFDFTFVQPNDNKAIELRDNFPKYELDIDFGINTTEIIQVIIKAEINRGKKRVAGYSILAEVACLFEFNKQISVSDDARNSIEGFSTIYIALNTLRGVISNMTTNAPLGKYLLPSIDLNDLISQKKSQLVENENFQHSDSSKAEKRKKS